MDAKDLVQRGADAWNSKDQEGFFATYADDCEVTAPGFTGKGLRGLADFWNVWHSGFSDNQVTLRLVFAGNWSGHRVGISWLRVARVGPRSA
jgi:hypothetical protein